MELKKKSFPFPIRVEICLPRVPHTSKNRLRSSQLHNSPRKLIFTQGQKLIPMGTENDVVFLRGDGARNKNRCLSPPLKPDTLITMKRTGKVIRGSDIIGRNIREKVRDSGGRECTILEATLATYTVLTRRMVTPLYPKAAGLITSLLDIGLPCPGEDSQFDNSPPFEILEAGTGHGALTLHLARAIHGANPPVPPEIRDELVDAQYTTSPRNIHRVNAGLFEPGLSEKRNSISASVSTPTLEPELSNADPLDPHPLSLSESARVAFENHRSIRRAIIHTFDINPQAQRQAHQIVRRFKRGLYLPAVDFHTGHVRAYLAERLDKSGGTPFLAHCVLDLGDPLEVGITDEICRALLPGGLLLVFNPSITQIVDVLAEVRDTRSMFNLERVVEIGSETPDAGEVGNDDAQVGGGRDWLVAPVPAEEGKREKYKCRPKIGTQLSAGGFVGIFRKFHVVKRLPESSFDLPKEGKEGACEEGALLENMG